MSLIDSQKKISSCIAWCVAIVVISLLPRAARGASVEQVLASLKGLPAAETQRVLEKGARKEGKVACQLI
ncbi:MAG: hypothetical protein HY695_05870 [Deltaproteobacteria bacterium]|nr:hypothetical protein [Deltaproteobacteria bacterium]